MENLLTDLKKMSDNHDYEIRQQIRKEILADPAFQLFSKLDETYEEESMKLLPYLLFLLGSAFFMIGTLMMMVQEIGH